MHSSFSSRDFRGLFVPVFAASVILISLALSSGHHVSAPLMIAIVALACRSIHPTCLDSPVAGVTNCR
jgi:hypothetical protein